MFKPLRQLIALIIVCGLSLQLYFLGRIALMASVDPQSTTFQRSEIARLAIHKHHIAWDQDWRPYEQISNSLKRCVIAAEDAGFAEHSGVEWDAIEQAWERNQRAELRASAINAQLEERAARRAERLRKAGAASTVEPKLVKPKIVGGSTITQQLAKNLFLSSERTAVRKGQEFVITFMLEALLTKERILEIYLNNVEWGEGVFGAQAAARHYFRSDAQDLRPWQAARLAVMLPAPKRFQQRVNTAYMHARASAVLTRMGAMELP